MTSKQPAVKNRWVCNGLAATASHNHLIRLACPEALFTHLAQMKYSLNHVVISTAIGSRVPNTSINVRNPTAKPVANLASR